MAVYVNAFAEAQYKFPVNFAVAHYNGIRKGPAVQGLAIIICCFLCGLIRLPFEGNGVEAEHLHKLYVGGAGYVLGKDQAASVGVEVYSLLHV